MDLRIKIFLIFLFVFDGSAETFDNDRDCPSKVVASRCHCTSEVIECRNQALNEVPSFVRTTWPFKILDLSRNNISRIDIRAFDNVNVTEINLSDNVIYSVHNEAFNAIRKQLNRLDLRNNSLTQLPTVLKILDNLTMIDVSYNPISHRGFTDDVMRQIGDFVQEFRFGDPTLQEWPDTLHHFPELRILKFYGGTMDRIPITAFAGFEWTLRKLWMQDTNLIAVPIALQDLHSADELHFDNNVHVKDAGILIPAFAGMTTSLQTMTLENNGLSTFPPVLQTLLSLHNLSLARNDLQIVDDNAVSVVGSNLTTLDLQGCNLDRIPGALSKLGNLMNLDISYNKITTIEKNDLQAMTQLRSLTLSHNPLQYVSKSTFHDLTRLESLVVQNTSLYEVPEAVKNIPHLTNLDLTNPTAIIECNCNLIWLFCFTKTNNTHLTIKGDCYTVVSTIDAYVKTDVKITCPYNC